MKKINSKEINETDGKEVKKTDFRPSFGKKKYVPSYTSPNSTGDTLLRRSVFKKSKEVREDKEPDFRPSFGKKKYVPSYTSPNSTGDTLFKKYKDNKDA